MKKGFTLIELLGVLIVLAVIALITTPMILDVVDEAKRKSNLNSAHAYIEAAKLYYYEAQFDNDKMSDLNNLNNIYDKITIKGTKPNTGELYATNNGKFGLALEIDGECYYKDFDGELSVTDLELCSLGWVGIDEVKPTLEFSYDGTEGSNEWYKGELWLTIKVLDTESGPSSIKWCMGDNCEPTEEEKVITKSLLLQNDTETVICAVGYDRYGNASEKICSKDIKIDKQGPNFSGIEDLTVMKDSVLDLRYGVTVEDNLSGVTDFTVTPESVSTSVAGTTTVTYTAIDNAGNETTIERIIVVDALAPTVTYTAEAGKINANGWAKEDFFVDITINDQSGLGIKEFYVCTGNINDRCTPQEGSHFTSGNTAQRTITVEDGNNRICIQATDNNNRTSEVLCSDAYKLDRTAPTGSISSTNNLAISQTAALTLLDSVGVVGYYWGTEAPTASSTYTPLDNTTSLSLDKNITDVGTYYLSVIDIAGNISDLISTDFYKTTLNVTNGTLSLSYVITESGKSFNLPTPTASANHTNIGTWNTNSSYTGTNYQYGVAYTPTSSSTLYTKANLNKHTLTLTKGTGISTIYYKINDASSYTSATATQNLNVNYGSTYYYYGVASTGYTISTCTQDSPCSGVMSASGASHTLSATLNQYNLTLTKGTGISTIYYKVNGASSYTSATATKTVAVNYGSTYYYYGVASTGYTISTCTQASPCSGVMGTSGENKSLNVTLNQYKITVTSNNTSYGTISPASQNINHGSSATITITPAAGYKYSSNNCGAEPVNGKITLNNVTAAKNCTVNFTARTYACSTGTLTKNTSYSSATFGNICVVSGNPSTTCKSCTYMIRSEEFEWNGCFEEDYPYYQAEELCKEAGYTTYASAYAAGYYYGLACPYYRYVYDSIYYTCEKSETAANCTKCGSTTTYSCPSGYSTYSGSGSSLKCYKAATET